MIPPARKKPGGRGRRPTFFSYHRPSARQYDCTFAHKICYISSKKTPTEPFAVGTIDITGYSECASNGDPLLRYAKHTTQLAIAVWPMAVIVTNDTVETNEVQ
ncbi:hypothetical protein B4Q04_21275 [Zobellia sp. OII3]|nr:hypothetical protein B4Q04_21275 [Zobellia sp. OII3]